MNKEIKRLIFVFSLISLIKIILNYFVKSPSEFSDAYFYTLSAKSLINFDLFNFFAHYPPLYPLIISWAYLFSDSNISYFLIKLTNSLISSLVIFPAYLLAKEYLKDEKISFYCAVIIALLPSNFSYSAFIMSENLFNFLFLLTIYTLYLGFKKGRNGFLVLSSLLIVLSYSTRITGIALFPIVILFALTEKKYKEGLFVLILSVIMLVPYFMLKDSIIVGYEGPISKISKGTINFLEILFWIILYPIFIYLQGFIIFANSAIKSFKNNILNRLFIISIFLFTAMAAYHAIVGSAWAIFPEISGRPIGRYTAAILPLIVIMGINNLRRFKVNYLWALPFSVLMLYPLLPPNNIDVTWLGIFSLFIKNQSILIKVIINLIICLLIIFAINRIRKYINLKSVIFSLFILNLVIFTGISYNADKYYFDRDDTKAGIYLNKMAPDSMIVIDKEECTERWTKESKVLCDNENKMSLIGFWNKKVIIGDYKDGDYFVSKKELNLKKIKQFGDIIIYET